MHPAQVVHRLPEEAGARHSGHAHFPDHPLTELQVGPALELGQRQKIGNIDHHKIGALRNIVLQPHTVQPGQKMIALFGVKGLQLFVIAGWHLQTGHSGLL